MMPGMQENGDAAIHVIGNIRKEDVPGIVENNRFDGQTVICTEDLMLAAIEDESMSHRGSGHGNVSRA